MKYPHSFSVLTFDCYQQKKKTKTSYYPKSIYAKGENSFNYKKYNNNNKYVYFFSQRTAKDKIPLPSNKFSVFCCLSR